MNSHLFSYLALLLLLIGTPACIAQNGAVSPRGMAIKPGGITLSPADAQAVGKKIWQNECSGTIEGLTSWNEGEDFPSLGIGHFIWYVDGREGPFEESFPPLIEFMKRLQVPNIPAIAQSSGSPWNSRETFLAQQSSPGMRQLRSFLANTVGTQTAFIVQRLEAAMPKMLAETRGATEKERLRRNFYAVAESRQGIYALIDYVNFKGEGTNPNERYQGQGWGLRDVLLAMQGNPRGVDAAIEFGEAAKRTLLRRIANSPPERGESRWKAGWMNRCKTYQQSF